MTGGVGTAECNSFGGREKVTGFADTVRAVRYRTNDTDSAPAQGMDVRTRPHRTDGLRQS
jgi:hypothetical protein